jgi:exosortase N
VLRIVLLVQFAVPPEAVMHDAIGLACLLLYVCVPACYLAKFFVARATAHAAAQTTAQQPKAVVQWALLAALLMLGQRVKTVDTYATFADNYAAKITGYKSSVYSPGILKLENNSALVYVKFIRGFYDTEHNPTLCWKGSGYEFSNVKKQTLANKEVYTAMLCRGQEKLHTAWWYGNAKTATTSQWAWRWDMLKGASEYAVINVTTSNETALAVEVKKVLHSQTLLPLLKE